MSHDLIVIGTGPGGYVCAIRAAQLGITIVQNGTPSKVQAYTRILAGEQLTDADVAYMGDDVVDLGVLARAVFRKLQWDQRAGSLSLQLA